jgi:hypothetical protein
VVIYKMKGGRRAVNSNNCACIQICFTKNLVIINICSLLHTFAMGKLYYFSLFCRLKGNPLASLMILAKLGGEFDFFNLCLLITYQ